jgi:hypothetical protein
MTEAGVLQEISSKKEIHAAETACRHAISSNYADFADRLVSLPRDAEGCFNLLSGITCDQKSLLTLRRLKAEATRLGLQTANALERFVVLKAYLAALPCLPSLPVDHSVHRQFCSTCRQVASLVDGSDARFSLESDAFAELAQIVTLRRYHAGQLSFDITKMARAWLLKVHPIELPGLIREISAGIGGFGPVVVPHINYWRKNPLFIFKGEQEQALWRIAKSIERDDRVKGMIASSWLYSVAVGESFPHLAWVREFFIEQNAYVVDAGPALVDAGFLIGSKKRRQLYTSGNFHPRETIVLWRRAHILEWAAKHPQFGDCAHARNVSVMAMQAATHLRTRRKPSSQRILLSGQCTLIDCKRLLLYKPRHYIALTLLLPAFCAALIVGAGWSAAGVLPVLFLTVLFMWVFQYFFLQ